MKPIHLLLLTMLATAAFAQTDPGPRPSPPPIPIPLRGLSPAESALFFQSVATFNEHETVAAGLGPRFNLDSCAGCHAQPAAGGSSPAQNPQVAVPHNTIPSFLQSNGPVRVVRFLRQPSGQPDGGVHDLFVITGRDDAPSACKIQQPDFSQTNNMTFRIPTPLFGLGLMEAISDATLQQSFAATALQRQSLGIAGHFNTSGNDGTITRFGWKAQNKSMLMFAGEAYNVEMGVTNELFPQERETDPGCATNATPEDHTNVATGAPSDLQLFTAFMRYLAPPPPPRPGPDPGAAVFGSLGCNLCHTPTFQTSPSTTAALSNQRVFLFSDLALHRMGQALADGVQQGNARGDEFRTAPLWGLADRLFFLHDGRSRDLLETIQLHDSPGSEAHQVIQNFNALPPQSKQDLLNYLRTI
ncbi:MAG TPA: di-heme oxidoredictase family protein [Bryobacteraceae bacterium]